MTAEKETEMATSVSYIFSTLEKFADDSKMSLNQWLRKFDRCCIVANKAKDSCFCCILNGVHELS